MDLKAPNQETLFIMNFSRGDLMKLLETIRNNAQKYSGNIAFINKGDIISYSQLWKRSDLLASYILEIETIKQSPIIVYGHMEPGVVVAFLGSVKSGHAYIPVDSSTPLNRLQQIIEKSNAEILINFTDIVMDNVNEQIKLLNTADLNAIFSRPYTELSDETWVKDDDNFYIIFTSGSTGNPKGVQISYSNLNSFVGWILSDFDIENNQTFLNQAPFSFDLSVMDLYPSLASGGTIYAVDKATFNQPKILFDEIAKSNLNIWVSTPSVAQMFFLEPTFNQDMLPKLKKFMFCGEALSVDIANELKNRFPSATIYNTYGPTEATVAVTSIIVKDEMLENKKALPVGKVKDDCKVYIINPDGEFQNQGDPGEIVIAGESVSKGYLGEPNLTNKSFFEIDGRAAYKTGDTGFIRNNLLYCLGRIDYQIKLNGYRMEIEEIEHHILRSKFVKHVVVMPVKRKDKITHLLAAVVANEHDFTKDFELTKAIKKDIQKYLPDYMIPRVFKYVTAVPITNNGKLDRKKIADEMLT